MMISCSIQFHSGVYVHVDQWMSVEAILYFQALELSQLRWRCNVEIGNLMVNGLLAQLRTRLLEFDQCTFAARPPDIYCGTYVRPPIIS